MLRHSVLWLLCIITYVLNQHLNLPEGSSCTWSGLNGQCVNAYRCLSAVKDVQDKIFPPICSFDGRTPIICCTDCELVKDTRLLLFNTRLGILTKTGTSRAKDRCIQYHHDLEYIDDACDEYIRDLVYVKNIKPGKNCTVFEHYHSYNSAIRGHGAASGGVGAKRGDFPHMALLGYGDTIETAQWLCGGSVISERFILTAAHCLSGPSVGPVRYIVLGILSRSDPKKLWQIYLVQRAIRHPGYMPPSKYHDIALLETDREIVYSFDVYPACLHTNDDGKIDDYAFATGWGALGHRQGLADVLQSVSLHRFNEKECSQYYPRHRLLRNGFDENTQMCYGDRNDTEIPTDTCEGDSGGPLQSNQHEQCVTTIIGVTSYGRQCGISGGSGIYTRVAYYVPWIEDIVCP